MTRPYADVPPPENTCSGCADRRRDVELTLGLKVHNGDGSTDPCARALATDLLRHAMIALYSEIGSVDLAWRVLTDLQLDVTDDLKALLAKGQGVGSVEALRRVESPG